MSTPFAHTLHKLYGHLRAHFGYTPAWWPGDPTEIVFSAILVQQCGWTQAWRAVRRLREEGLLVPDRLERQTPEAVEKLIRPVAFSPTKSRRIIALAAYLADVRAESVEQWLDPHRRTDEVRRELLSLSGIGKETADSILLYASNHPRFVVDTYTCRVFGRLSVLEEVSSEGWTTPTIPLLVAVYRDVHAQIVELAKHHCLGRRPRCTEQGARGWDDYPFCKEHCLEGRCYACPLFGMCATGQGA
jgi:endonuclease-3 related protein